MAKTSEAPATTDYEPETPVCDVCGDPVYSLDHDPDGTPHYRCALHHLQPPEPEVEE